MTQEEIEKENKEINSSINILYNEIVNLRKKLTQNRASFIKTNLKREEIKKIKTNLNVPINRNNPTTPVTSGTDRIVIKRN